MSIKIGDTLLVGVNYFNENGEWLRSEQEFGEITSIQEHTIRIRSQESGHERSFPLIEDAIEEGDGGAYQFHETATPVINPSYVATFRATVKD